MDSLDMQLVGLAATFWMLVFAAALWISYQTALCGRTATRPARGSGPRRRAVGHVGTP
jgi:hypothetical protein